MREIEKDVPVPDMESGYGRSGKGKILYPEFRQMDVGDSVFFDDQPKGGRSNPVVSARMYAQKEGKKFSARKEGNGVRIWRIA